MFFAFLFTFTFVFSHQLHLFSGAPILPLLNSRQLSVLNSLEGSTMKSCFDHLLSDADITNSVNCNGFRSLTKCVTDHPGYDFKSKKLLVDTFLSGFNIPCTSSHYSKLQSDEPQDNVNIKREIPLVTSSNFDILWPKNNQNCHKDDSSLSDDSFPGWIKFINSLGLSIMAFYVIIWLIFRVVKSIIKRYRHMRQSWENWTDTSIIIQPPPPPPPPTAQHSTSSLAVAPLSVQPQPNTYNTNPLVAQQSTNSDSDSNPFQLQSVYTPRTV